MKFGSTYLLAAALIALFGTVHAQTFTHKPFLQQGTPNSAMVCWRLSAAASLTVRYGTDSTNLTQTSAASANTASSTCVTLSGLTPATRYYYQAYNGANLMPGQHPLTHQFVKTSPVVGTKGHYTFWLPGDHGVGTTGTDNTASNRNRNAFIRVNGSTWADGLMYLGDLSYESGTVTQLTQGTFDIMHDVMANTVVWPSMGNHETYTDQAAAYLDAFNLPKAAEAGGVASNSENYYSFNYGNIHFIVLEMVISSRSTTGAQYTWLQQDLQSPSAQNADWTIAYWHHGPYTCCHHNSETESDLSEVRARFVPLLEQYGVDFVFVGHSHNYERSFLMDSAYGVSAAVNQTANYNWFAANRSRVLLDTSSGNPDSTGPYHKTKGGRGTIYTVAGSTAKLNVTSGKHPLMRYTKHIRGSLILNVDGDSLATVRFIDTSGAVVDKYALKQTGGVVAIQNPARGENAVLPAPKFTQAGRRLRFPADNNVALRIYSLQGGMIYQGTPSGPWEPSHDLLPSGAYFYRFGASLGKITLP